MTQRKGRQAGRKPRASFAERDLTCFVRKFITTKLADGDARIGAAAAAANMSVRSLQRRLVAADLIYKELIGEIRLDEAMRLLIRTEKSIAEISADLGYADPAHFTRAFRRWTGEAPSSFRQRLAPDG